MAEKFKWTKFADVNLKDQFFDSLKIDYPEFVKWFTKKSDSGAKALVAKDDCGVTAFLYMKDEDEEIELVGKAVPAKPRIKIGTFKIDKRLEGIRQGEGMLGVALWRWQESLRDEIYITVFPKHNDLIGLITKYGFRPVGTNSRGENVFFRSRTYVDFSTPFSSFPFIKGGFGSSYLLVVDDEYHDKLFPFSELQRNQLEVEEIAAGNGISKVFIGYPYNNLSYKEGKPILIYRKHTGEKQAAYVSCVTSFCTLTKIIPVKQAGKFLLSFEKFKSLSGNKTVYAESELLEKYQTKNNIVLLELVYNGYFGKGNNINYKKMKSLGYFNDTHPYQMECTEQNFIDTLKEGKVNVQNVIINQT